VPYGGFLVDLSAYFSRRVVVDHPHGYFALMSTPRCYGNFAQGKLLCESCHVVEACRELSPEFQEEPEHPTVTEGVCGQVEAESFDLSLTLYSGQTFRWGRDMDGWWKGIAYGVAFHLKQEEEVLKYVASSEQIQTYAGSMRIETFLPWYLRILEQPRIRVPRADRYLRKARDLMPGFRFVRQDPWECTMSYILSVQAHMALTKRRIHFIAHILGNEIQLRGERFWTFPSVDELSLLDEGYFRHQRFGWRSKFLPTSANHVNNAIGQSPRPAEQPTGLSEWRAIIDDLRGIPNSGVGLKVAKCIDLFSLDRLGAVPVDTWVRKCAADWYGIEGSDARICSWAEERGGKLAGYWNEYLFAYYRELNAPRLDERVLSFAASDAPSAVLPFELIAKDHE